MAAALPFIAPGSRLIQGVAGNAAAKRNAKRLEAQGVERVRTAAAQGRRVRADARRAIGEQLAMQAGNGLEGASAGDTAFDLLRESQVEAALDVMELRRQGAGEANALFQQASDTRREGRFALLEGVLGAGSSYMGMRSDWAQARRDSL